MSQAERQTIEHELRERGGHLPKRPKLVSIPVFGEEVGVGRTKAYELVDRGEVETVFIDSRRLVVADSIDDYVQRLRQTAGA